MMQKRIAIISASLLIAISCLSYGNSAKGETMETDIKKLPIAGEAFTLEGHAAFIISPAVKASDAKTPWIWYAPTLPGLPGVEEIWMFEKFLAAGIAIAGIDVGESYGSPQGRKLFSLLYEELVQKRNFFEKACLLARSRGGLMLYNWAAEHPECIACIAGIYPVCNLTSYPGIKNAYGAYEMSEEELAANLTKHNPIDRLEGLAKERVPIFHIHGDSDEVVPLEKNSGELARRYHELKGEMKLVIPEGQGHNMWQGFFQCQELVDFVIKYRFGVHD